MPTAHDLLLQGPLVAYCADMIADLSALSNTLRVACRCNTSLCAVWTTILHLLLQPSMSAAAGRVSGLCDRHCCQFNRQGPDALKPYKGSVQDDHCMLVPAVLADTSALAKPDHTWHSAISRCAAV